MNLRELGVKGCREGYCHLAGYIGNGEMHTNGRCRCLNRLPSMERVNVERALRLLRERIKELEDKV